MFKNYDLADLAECIDWAPFFQTWDLAGPFPAILKDEIVGTEAQRVFSDGKRMLQRLIEGRWLTANAVLGLYPAAQVNDDDIEIYRDESRSEVLMTWRGLRMQSERPVVDGEKRPNRCLADYIAPKGAQRAPGRPKPAAAPAGGRSEATVGAGSCPRLHRPVRRHCRHRLRKEGSAVPGRS